MPCIEQPLNGTLAHLFTIAGHCTEHGTCVNGTCICNAGWTGVSDKFSLEGTSCHIRVEWHPYFFGLLLFVQFQATYRLVNQLRPIINRIRNRRRLRMENGQPSQLTFAQFKADATAASAYDPLTILAPQLGLYILNTMYFALKGFVLGTALGSRSSSSIVLTILQLLVQICGHTASVVERLTFLCYLVHNLWFVFDPNFSINAARVQLETSTRVLNIDHVGLLRYQNRILYGGFVVGILCPSLYYLWNSVTGSSRYPNMHGTYSLLLAGFGASFVALSYLPTIYSARRRFQEVLSDLRNERDQLSYSIASRKNEANAMEMQRGAMILRLENAIAKLDENARGSRKAVQISFYLMLLSSLPQVFAYHEYIQMIYYTLSLLLSESRRKLFASTKNNKVKSECSSTKRAQWTNDETSSMNSNSRAYGDLFASSAAES